MRNAHDDAAGQQRMLLLPGHLPRRYGRAQRVDVLWHTPATPLVPQYDCDGSCAGASPPKNVSHHEPELLLLLLVVGAGVGESHDHHEPPLSLPPDDVDAPAGQHLMLVPPGHLPVR